MLSADLIISRRSGYACCAAEASSKALDAIIVGDKDCYKKYLRIATWYRWGADVMKRTPATGDEDCCGSAPQCVTDAFALATIKKIDALDGCVKCGCGAPEDRPIVCVVSPDHTVAAATDASYQALANPVLPYLIVTDLSAWPGTWGSHVSEIVVGTTFTPMPIGDVTLDSFQSPFNYNAALWVQTSAGQGKLFPVITGTLVLTTLTLASRYPAVNALLQRTAVIRISPDATNWTPVFSGNESLIDGLAITVPADTLYMQTKYFYEQDDTCETEFNYGLISIDSNPPQSSRSYQVPVGGNIQGSNTNEMQFVPWFEPQWTFSMWFLLNEASVGNPADASFSLYQSDTGTSYSQFTAGLGRNGGGSFEFYYEPGSPSTPWAVATDSIPGFDQAQWHHFAIVKDAQGAADANNLADYTTYVDGAPVGLSQISSNPAAPFIDPVTLTLAVMQRLDAGEDVFFDEVYMEPFARTATEIATVHMPNLMQQVYGSGWLFWYRAEPPDDLTAPPFSTPNSLVAPFIQAVAGSPSLSTNIPPLLA